MSLAYKLWKIGNVLTEDDIKASIKENPTFKDGEEPIYLNIDFKFIDNKIASINLNKNSVSKDKLFFTKKIGGTSNAFYLYPNITVLDDYPVSKLTLLYNSLEYCTKYFCIDNSRLKIDLILDEIKDIKEHIKRVYYEYQIKQIQSDIEKTEDKELKALNKKLSKSEKELKIMNNEWNQRLLDVLNEIAKLGKNNYIICLSINNKTFFEEMPEVWNNWYKTPVKYDKLANGYDLFTNKETDIGYKTEVKVFSYDQYHDSLNHRLNDNLPLSLESARNIKFAWIYILDNLVFYYKRLEYIIIPNLLSDNDDIYRLIIKRLVQAKTNTDTKKGVLERLKKEENELKKNIDKLRKKKLDYSKDKDALKNISSNIKQKDLGMIQEFNEQVLTIDEYINSVTLDYLFTSINRTNLSFEIKGTIEDVIPSKINDLVKHMRNDKINDLVKLGSINRNETHLQNFFNRDELYFAINKSSKNNANSILTERLYLAKLLLSDSKIKKDDLLKRFEFNRLYDYEHKKRIKNGVAEWIEYPESFVEKENNIIKFLKTINKIQE